MRVISTSGLSANVPEASQCDGISWDTVDYEERRQYHRRKARKRKKRLATYKAKRKKPTTGLSIVRK